MYFKIQDAFENIQKFLVIFLVPLKKEKNAKKS